MAQCSFIDFAPIKKTKEHNRVDIDRPVICVQGLGFVGAAMAVATASARDSKGSPYFNVIGVDLPSSEGLTRIAAINEGTLPFKCEDQKLIDRLREAHLEGNLIATSNPEVYSLAAVILIDVNLDVNFENGKPSLSLDGFHKAVATLGKYMQPGCLVIVETTVPPGTCEKIIAPILTEKFKERGLPENSLLLAHSYERVMPGKDYYDSIVNFWRVYAGYSPEAAQACENFLSKIINVKDYPLTRLSSTTASETGKVLENSYRAMNIAFMEEWGRFAETVGIDLFEVIQAIRKRPTHSNIRQPGFGVGGYCLTKDPLIPEIAAKEIFGFQEIQFPFCSQAVAINRAMPLVTLDKVQALVGGDLRGKHILLLGVSYRQDIGDSRHSPSKIFVEQARQRGAKVICHDPYLDYWSELEEELVGELPSLDGIDAVVFAVPHEPYSKLDFEQWLGDNNPLFFDANDVLSEQQRKYLKLRGCKFASIGRGDK